MGLPVAALRPRYGLQNHTPSAFRRTRTSATATARLTGKVEGFYI